MRHHRSPRVLIRTLPWLVVSVFVVALTAATPPNGESTRLLRSPTVSASQVAFAYANNIWTVDRGGGVARRITTFQGQTSSPRFSPDGQWIAFSGE
jgi:tricorn protease